VHKKEKSEQYTAETVQPFKESSQIFANLRTDIVSLITPNKKKK
jgi:hypothetical protein